MKFLADECCSMVIINALRDAGHDVIAVRESRRGVDDETILNLAANEDRILITEDKDFGDLVVNMRRVTAGVILIRSESSKYQSVMRMLCSYIRRYPAKCSGHFIVATPRQLRVRVL